MVAINSVIKASGVGAGPRATLAFRNKTLKEGLQVMLRFWHRTYLHRHFESPASVKARYGDAIEPRTVKYQRKKAREQGRTSLLRWSGRTMLALLLGRPKTGGSTKRAWLELSWQTKRVNPKSRDPWGRYPNTMMAAELTVISASEQVGMARHLDAWLTTELKKPAPVEIISGQRGGPA